MPPAALHAIAEGWLKPRRRSWMSKRKRPAMARKRAAWPRWGMRTGGSAGGVPSAWGKKRVWSSGLTGGRKTGTVTAGSSDAKGRMEEDVLGVRSLMLVRAG